MAKKTTARTWKMSEGIRARILCEPDRARALEYLRADASENLVLLDFVEKLGAAVGAGLSRRHLFFHS